MLGINVAGVDVNTNRLNLVVVNRDGDVVWVHTARFPQVLARGYSGREGLERYR